MDLIMGVGFIGIGIWMTLTGFKVHNPFKRKMEAEKEELWYKKFGTFFKFGGIALLIMGITKVLGIT